VIKVHPATLIASRWIGVDLNTTGHVAVAADILSGKTMKLGKNIHYNHRQSQRTCTKLWKEGKLWKLKKVKSRERKTFKSALNAISRQIVSFAESLGSGIKFEKLFSPRYSHRHGVESSFEFSFENGSFFALQQQVEKRAVDRGIPVNNVNPAYTTNRSCRCGYFGRRSRKHFECPHCGYMAHADVNAAFNIAAASLRNASGEYLAHWEHQPARIGKKELKRQLRELQASQAQVPPAAAAVAELTSGGNMLAVLEQM
jgi:putative transposase